MIVDPRIPPRLAAILERKLGDPDFSGTIEMNVQRGRIVGWGVMERERADAHKSDELNAARRHRV